MFGQIGLYGIAACTGCFERGNHLRVCDLCGVALECSTALGLGQRLSGSVGNLLVRARIDTILLIRTLTVDQSTGIDKSYSIGLSLLS